MVVTVVTAPTNVNFTNTSFPLRHIPTAGASVTKVKDSLTGAGDATLFSSINSSGVLFLNARAFVDDSTYRIVGLSDGTTSNYIWLFYTSSSNTIRGIYAISDVYSADISYTIPDETQFAKFAFRWAKNDFSLWYNGAKVGEDLSGNVFTTNILNDLSANRIGALDLDFYGEIKEISISSYLTDAEMITKTT